MNELRWKMIRIAFLSVIIVFVLLSVIINFTISIHNLIQSDNITQLIADNNGHMPRYTVPHEDNDENGKNEENEDQEAFPWGYNEEGDIMKNHLTGQGISLYIWIHMVKASPMQQS